MPKEMVHYGFSKGAQLVIEGAAEQTKGTNVVNLQLLGPTWARDGSGGEAAAGESDGNDHG